VSSVNEDIKSPPYTKEYKLFVCPSSMDAVSKDGILTSGPDISSDTTTCSYSYAYGLSLQTHSDTAIMADRKLIGKATTTNANCGWHQASFYDISRIANAQHKGEGVNILYVGGHARWIQAGRCNWSSAYRSIDKNCAPNCGSNKQFPMYNLHSSY
jgi:prepilin-type processing-associated H-X9-DG protein